MKAPTRATTAALVAAAAVLATLGWMLLPFDAAGSLDCEAALLGSKPEERRTTGYLVGQEKSACQNRGNSRLIVSGIAGALFAVVGVAAVLLPESQMERVLYGRGDELPDYGP